MNSQIKILKIQKRKLIKQHDFSKKKPKTSIESKMIETNYDFCEYLVNKLELLVDFSVVEDAEIKLCSNCAIKKALFNSIHQLQYSIYKKLKEVKYTKFFSKDIIRIVLHNLCKILNEKDLYIEKYGEVVKTYNFPKNLQYNHDFNYNSDDETFSYFYS
ncbi:21049_t:CDS:2 [Gigaspora margarita]|uniref:21049_t:CDS:1 n=1 Tax=Gigaspora margarita TaxID=4874 RepID=A0ABN7VT55_GIGMA|nr:21049_t:CDS:2 [Gigaspora margarita]